MPNKIGECHLKKKSKVTEFALWLGKKATEKYAWCHTHLDPESSIVKILTKSRCLR